MSRFKLPFLDKSLVNCYHNLAFPMGIIEANAELDNEDITPWVISKYINPLFMETSPNNAYDICTYDRWGTNDGILYHQYVNLFKSTYDCLEIDVIKSICAMIKNGCYITGVYNEKYIPGKMVYNQSDFVHDYILYGFDEEKQTFLSAGYLADRRYQSYEISFSNFAQSINSVGGDRLQFGFWTYNHNYHYQYNGERVLGELNDYIKCTTSHNYRKNLYYGIEANRKLRDYLLYCITNYDTPVVDLRYSRAYMEHKSILYMCFKYLVQENLLGGRIDQNDMDAAYEIYQNAIMIHRTGIKLNLTKKYDLIKHITKLFDINESKEVEIITKIVSA